MAVLVAVQLSVLGLYLPPVSEGLGAAPPQTIISLPVHTADRKKKSRLLVSLPGPDKSTCCRFRSLDENKLRQGQVAWISDLEIEIIIENESDLTTESLDS